MGRKESNLTKLNTQILHVGDIFPLLHIDTVIISSKIKIDDRLHRHDPPNKSEVNGKMASSPVQSIPGHPVRILHNAFITYGHMIALMAQKRLLLYFDATLYSLTFLELFGDSASLNLDTEILKRQIV